MVSGILLNDVISNITMSVRKSKTLRKKKQEKPYLTLSIKEIVRSHAPIQIEKEERMARSQRMMGEIKTDSEIKIKLDLLKKNVPDAFEFFQQNISNWAGFASRDKIVMVVDNIIHNTKDRIPKGEMDKTFRELEEKVYKERRKGIKKLIGIE